ncbi:MAG: hypothetical protein HC828_15995 [Blastochloris sp.]|nr:hypothetical protein [Chloroflexaceae bacterium]NJO84135.1 hypothetical protein [Blastochloris sp.]
MTNTTTETLTIDTLLEEGRKALQAGDAYAASKQFRRVTELAPDNIEGWLGMAYAVRSYLEKREFLQRVLAIEPENSTAQEQLAEVERRIAAGELLAPKLARVAPGPQTAPDEIYPSDDAATAETAVQYCYRHPSRETGLNCVQCGRPICTECVRPAFVGQLCPECAQERRPRNYKVTPTNLVSTGVLALVAGLLGSWLSLQLPFAIFLSFILAPIYGELFVRLTDRITQAKRGRPMQLTAGLAMAAGFAPLGILTLMLWGFPNLGLLVFGGIAIFTIVTRLR